MLKIDFSKKSQKQLASLPAKNQRQISEKIMALAEHHTLPSAQALTGRLLGYHRLKVGEFRVVFKQEAETIHIVTIGKRNDDEVYRSL